MTGDGHRAGSGCNDEPKTRDSTDMEDDPTAGYCLTEQAYHTFAKLFAHASKQGYRLLWKPEQHQHYVELGGGLDLFRQLERRPDAEPEEALTVLHVGCRQSRAALSNKSPRQVKALIKEARKRHKRFEAVKQSFFAS